MALIGKFYPNSEVVATLCGHPVCPTAAVARGAGHMPQAMGMFYHHRSEDVPIDQFDPSAFEQQMVHFGLIGSEGMIFPSPHSRSRIARRFNPQARVENLVHTNTWTQQPRSGAQD